MPSLYYLTFMELLKLFKTKPIKNSLVCVIAHHQYFSYAHNWQKPRILSNQPVRSTKLLNLDQISKIKNCFLKVKLKKASNSFL